MLHLILTGTETLPGHLQQRDQGRGSDPGKLEPNMHLHAWRTSAAPTVSSWPRSS